MLEETLAGLVTLLAFAGGAALLGRLARASLRLGIRAAEVAATSGLAKVSARQGDVTALIERRDAEAKARAGRRGALLGAAAWLLWLGVPVLSGWTREAYALAALLWLVPSAPVTRSQLPVARESVES